MKIDLKSGEICLSDNQPISLRQARGLCVTSTAGTIWITVAGEPDDIFLQAGQSHQLSSNRLAIVESIGAGRIRLTKPALLSGLGQRVAAIYRQLERPKKTGPTGPVFLEQP